MKAAVVQKRGPALFRLQEVPIPAPGPGQVLIKVESAGVNFSDVKRRRGDAYPFETVFPFIPGGEIAGVVEALGPGVEAPSVGTRVFALAGANGYGGYAQFAVAYAPTVHPIPGPLGLDAACVLTIAGGTAKVLLKVTAQLQKGESILIPAAAGGVGSFALQIARQMEAGTVIAAVGDEGKRKTAMDLGANHVVVTSHAGWAEEARSFTAGKGIDVVLEATGGSALEQSLAVAAPFARIIVFGAASGQSATLSQDALDRLFYNPVSNQTLSGFNIGDWFQHKPHIAGAALGELIGDVLQGNISLPTITPLPLADAQRAHEMLEQRQVIGKLVLKPWQ
jgi:NADPH:quinone reductase-like Zn-dependent oxidoreductase